MDQDSGRSESMEREVEGSLRFTWGKVRIVGLHQFSVSELFLFDLYVFLPISSRQYAKFYIITDSNNSVTV